VWLYYSGIRLLRPFRAWTLRLDRHPRALPWAMIWRPFRALPRRRCQARTERNRSAEPGVAVLAWHGIISLLQSLNRWVARTPLALPWAMIWRPFRALPRRRCQARTERNRSAEPGVAAFAWQGTDESFVGEARPKPAATTQRRIPWPPAEAGG
jgi:hypothetical protein